MGTVNPDLEFTNPYELRQLKPETYKKVCENYGVRDLWDLEMDRLHAEAKIVQRFNEIKNLTNTSTMTPEEIVNQINIKVKLAEREDGSPIFAEVSMNERSKYYIEELIHSYGMEMYAKGFNDAVAVNAKQNFEEHEK